MLGFVSEELVWAVAKEREGEVRVVRPHTEGTPDVRAPREHEEHRITGTWLAPFLRAGAAHQ